MLRRNTIEPQHMAKRHDIGGLSSVPTKFGFPEDAFASYDLLSYELRRRGSNSGNAYLRDRLTSLALRLPKQGITGSDMESLIDEAMQLANRQKQEVARIAIGAFGEATLATVQP